MRRLELQRLVLNGSIFLFSLIARVTRHELTISATLALHLEDVQELPRNVNNHG